MLTLDNFGHFRLASVNNDIDFLRINKTVLFCERDQVLCPDGEIHFCMPVDQAAERIGYGWIYGVLDLNGHPQTASVLKSSWNAAHDEDPTKAHCRAYVDSATAASLTLTGTFSESDSLRCVFRQAAGLTVAGSGTLRFTKWISTSSGSLKVESGVFSMDAGGGWGGTNAEVVVTGGQLAVASGAAGTAFGGARSRVKLSVSGSGTIDIADGCEVTVSRFVVDGTPVEGGRYGGAGSGADTRYAAKFGTGKGVLRVLRPRGIVFYVK